MLPVCASKLLAVSGHDIRNMRMKRSASYFSLFSLGYHQESIEHITENRGNLIFRSCLLVQGHSQNATPSHIHRPETLKSGRPSRTCSDVFVFIGFRSNTGWFHMVSCFMYAESATQLLSRDPRGSPRIPDQSQVSPLASGSHGQEPGISPSFNAQLLWAIGVGQRIFKRHDSEIFIDLTWPDDLSDLL